MVCRSTPGNSGITSFARHNSGLLDVQVLSMFHEVRASVPRDLPGPTRAEVQRFTALAIRRVEADTTLPARERRMTVNRLTEAARGPLPDGRTYYAWQNIEAATARSATAMDAHFAQLANDFGGEPERYRNAFNQMMRRDFRINGDIPRAPEHVAHFTENVPRDRGTRVALAMLHRGAARYVERNDTDQLGVIYRTVHAQSDTFAAHPELNPANNCPDCGQFAGQDHVCEHNQVLAESHIEFVRVGLAAIDEDDAPAAEQPASTPASPSAPEVFEPGILRPVGDDHYTYGGLVHPGLAQANRAITSGDYSPYRTTDGQEWSDRITAVRHQRRLDRMAGAHAAMAQAMASVDGSAVHIALDNAMRVVTDENGSHMTTDGRHFSFEADAYLHQFHLDNAPAGARTVTGQYPNGEQVGRDPNPCPDCGRFMALNGSHTCASTFSAEEPLAEWERELLQGDYNSAEAQARNEAEANERVARQVAQAQADRAAARRVATAVATEPTPAPAEPSAPTRRRNPMRTYRTDDGGSVRLMNVSALRAELRDMEPGENGTITDITVQVPNAPDAFGHISMRAVTGSVDVSNTGLRRTRNRDRYQVTTPERSLQCTCPQYAMNYDCVHVREAAERVQALLNDREPVAVAPAQAMEAVASDLRGEYDASLAAAQQARDAFVEGSDGVSYAESMSAFQTSWDEAKAHFASGETALPYMIENATNGLGARDGGRSFGLEIEIDFPSDMSMTAKNQVARAIYDAGLSDSPEVRPWHWRARAVGPGGRAFGGGYTDNPNMWSVEFDRTVDDVGGQRGCELVSPILYDTPDTWRNLKTILDIVEAHGGKATPRTGLHVNIGARDFDHTVDNHNRLIGLANGYEDVIVRAAHNPQAGRTHRGREYCRPMEMPANGYSSIRAAQRGIDPRGDHGSSHRAMINLDHVPAEGGEIQNSTRVEVRIFDGSTDPGRIQMATKMALGMVNASVRGTDTPAEPERAGTHRARNANPNGGRPRNLRGQDWENDTRSFRQFADAIFTRAEDKRQLTFAFASSRWQAS